LIPFAVLREDTEAMTEDTTTQPKMQTKIVPLIWGEPGTATLANQVVLQYDGNLIFLTFGQANPPVIWGDTEGEKQQQLDKVQSIVVAPVIRLVMAPENFRAVVEACQKHLAIIDGMDKSKQART
jgi:hypothetical protein